MKPLVILALAMCGPFLFLSSTPPLKKLSIQDALSNKQVYAKASYKAGLGHMAILLDVTSKCSEKVNIVIPAGTVFTASDPSLQDIFVVKDQQIVLDPSKKASVITKGFCCQASDRGPGEGSGYAVSFTSNEKLRQLAEHINKNNYPSDAYQAAVWSVSDGRAVTNVCSSDDDPVKPLRKFICGITGQEEKWYTTPQEVTFTPEQFIISVPVKVSGELTIPVIKGEQLKREVLDPDGKAIPELAHSSIAPMTGTLSYDFSLEVEGWEKGKYRVIVSANKKVVLTQEFEI